MSRLPSLPRLGLILPLLVLGGRAWAGEPQYAYAAPAAAYSYVSQDPWTDEDYRYRIGAGDEIALRFVVNPDLNAPVVIGPDGRGAFPLIGTYKLAGLTVDEADRALTAAYGQVLRNPQVEALVLTYGAAQIYVGGEVKEAGVKPIKGQITVTQAVMAAGGFTDEARTGQVVVLRQFPGEERPRMRVADVRNVLQGKAGGDMMLMPGDVVFAPKSKIAEVDLFVKQHLTNLIPFNLSYGFGP